MTTNKYLALWYYYDFYGERCAFAVSDKSYTLLKLHEDNIKNPNSCWHDNKEKVNEIKIEPIECYTYDEIIKKIVPYNESHIANDHEFYAINTLTSNEDFALYGLTFYDNIIIKIIDSDGGILDSNDYDNLNKGEILIYISKTIYNMWMKCYELYNKTNENLIIDSDVPTFFYTEWTSHDPVIPNIYYEEGIMNA